MSSALTVEGELRLRFDEILTDDALDFVAGYTIVNDVSARDVILRPDWPNFASDWLVSKNFDTATPIGPHMIPREFVPDPQDEETFLRSKLDWSELEQQPHADLLRVHRALLALRSTHPDLVDPHLAQVQVQWDDADRWLVVHRGSLRVAVNLADEPREVDLDVEATGVLFATGELPEVDGTLPIMCRSGNRSGRAVQWLVAQGYDVVNAEGGMLAWQAAGKQMVSETGEEPSVQ